MQLSLHADYALRVLIFLGTHPDRVITTKEISTVYGISRNHLVRVVETLAAHGYVKSQAGRSGGVTLAREPQSILIGEVVKQAEPNLRLVECFDRRSNTCKIAPDCKLKGILSEALSSFLNALNRYTLADILQEGGREKLAILFAVPR